MNDPKKKALRSMLSRTKEGKIILHSLHLSGTSPETLGHTAAYKAMQKIKAVGKVTSAYTGRIAKVAAGLIGIPPGAIDALAKTDPTAHKSLVSSIMANPAAQKAAAIVEAAEKKATGALSEVKPVYYVVGAAGIAAIIYMVTRKKRKA